MLPAEPPRLDAVLPPEMAEKAEQVGVRKAAMDAASTFVLAVLAGAFIALGGVFSNVVLASAAPSRTGWPGSWPGWCSPWA